MTEGFWEEIEHTDYSVTMGYKLRPNATVKVSNLDGTTEIHDKYEYVAIIKNDGCMDLVQYDMYSTYGYRENSDMIETIHICEPKDFLEILKKLLVDKV